MSGGDLLSALLIWMPSGDLFSGWQTHLSDRTSLQVSLCLSGDSVNTAGFTGATRN
jgi:hypothetical protein